MTKTDAGSAAQLYERALAIMSSRGSDVQEATKLLRDAWVMGEPRAAYALATWYLSGANGFEKDIERAFELLTAAADKKVPAALYDLAICYEKGVAVEVDLEEAFYLYLDAAIRGDQQAIFEVGRCYEHGIGVAQNRQIADIWTDRAEELGAVRND